MNILRLQPIQLLIRFHAQPASESRIKIHRVLRRRSRNVERAGAEVAGLGGGEVEEVGAEAAAAVGVAEVEELQLQPVALGAEAAWVETTAPIRRPWSNRPRNQPPRSKQSSRIGV